MTNCFYYSPDKAAQKAKQIAQLGIPAVLLFSQAREKDAAGSDAFAEDAPLQQAVREIKNNVGELLVATDLCLCAYTTTGHCGIVKDKKIDNDETCRALAKAALSHAKAGADIIAPSDMMDGRVAYIREALDENDFQDIAIMAYSAKYASCFYGPFRDVAGSAPTFGDRTTYQMDPPNADQALTEIQLDIEEGADIVMVKPALAYLDVISRARERFSCPIAAYNVSGEYMMLNLAAKQQVFDLDTAMMETLLSIKRAGANIIITYFAERAAQLLRGKS